jgi:polar amino acid transport system substrate-binding protein
MVRDREETHVRRLTTLAIVVVLAAGSGACSKHGAKNVYSCPDKGPGVGFTSVKSGKLTVQTALPAPKWWSGRNVEDLTGGFEFELAKDLCAQLGLKRVRIVDVDRTELVAGDTNEFDVALAQIAITPDTAKKVDLSTGYVTSDEGDEYAVLLPKGASNTKLVNTAISKLKSNGTLDALEKTWLTAS